MTEDIRTTWNAKAAEWSAQAGDPSHYFTRRSSFVADLVSRNLRSGAVLDVGCGTGLLCERLHGKGLDVCGTDLSEEMVRCCVERFQDLAEDAQARFAPCSRTTLPFADRKFDLVTAIGLLNYVEDWPAYLTLLRSRLRPGGHAVLMCTNRRGLFVAKAILHHFIRFGLFLPGRTGEWAEMLGNLFRTGIWSGGHVDRKRSRQCYSAPALDRLCAAQGLERVDAMATYRFNFLDRAPLQRGRVGQAIAPRLGWNYCGVYTMRNAPGETP